MAEKKGRVVDKEIIPVNATGLRTGTEAVKVLPVPDQFFKWSVLVPMSHIKAQGLFPIEKGFGKGFAQLPELLTLNCVGVA